MRRWAPILVLVTAVLVASCSRSTELATEMPTSTTPPKAVTQPLDEDAIAAGSAGIQQLEQLLDRLLASNDTCAILTQRDVNENQLDPTLFTSSAARQVLAQGLVEVFDHLIRISPVVIRQPLEDEKAVFQQVLAVVDQFANNPNAPDATDAISDLLNQPGFIQAQAQLNTFINQNCI
jgi:hypothetical protein